MRLSGNGMRSGPERHDKVTLFEAERIVASHALLLGLPVYTWGIEVGIHDPGSALGEQSHLLRRRARVSN